MAKGKSIDSRERAAHEAAKLLKKTLQPLETGLSEQTLLLLIQRYSNAVQNQGHSPDVVMQATTALAGSDPRRLRLDFGTAMRPMAFELKNDLRRARIVAPNKAALAELLERGRAMTPAEVSANLATSAHQPKLFVLPHPVATLTSAERADDPPFGAFLVSTRRPDRPHFEPSTGQTEISPAVPFMGFATVKSSQRGWLVEQSRKMQNQVRAQIQGTPGKLPPLLPSMPGAFFLNNPSYNDADAWLLARLAAAAHQAELETPDSTKSFTIDDEPWSGIVTVYRPSGYVAPAPEPPTPIAPQEPAASTAQVQEIAQAPARWSAERAADELNAAVESLKIFYTDKAHARAMREALLPSLRRVVEKMREQQHGDVGVSHGANLFLGLHRQSTPRRRPVDETELRALIHRHAQAEREVLADAEELVLGPNELNYLLDHSADLDTEILSGIGEATFGTGTYQLGDAGWIYLPEELYVEAGAGYSAGLRAIRWHRGPVDLQDSDQSVPGVYLTTYASEPSVSSREASDQRQAAERYGVTPPLLRRVGTESFRINPMRDPQADVPAAEFRSAADQDEAPAQLPAGVRVVPDPAVNLGTRIFASFVKSLREMEFTHVPRSRRQGVDEGASRGRKKDGRHGVVYLTASLAEPEDEVPQVVRGRDVGVGYRTAYWTGHRDGSLDWPVEETLVFTGSEAEKAANRELYPSVDRFFEVNPDLSDRRTRKAGLPSKRPKRSRAATGQYRARVAAEQPDASSLEAQSSPEAPQAGQTAVPTPDQHGRSTAAQHHGPVGPHGLPEVQGPENGGGTRPA